MQTLQRCVGRSAVKKDSMKAQLVSVSVLWKMSNETVSNIQYQYLTILITLHETVCK